MAGCHLQRLHLLVRTSKLPGPLQVRDSHRKRVLRYRPPLHPGAEHGGVPQHAGKREGGVPSDRLIEEGSRAFDLRDDVGFLRQVVRRILRGVPTEVAE